MDSCGKFVDIKWYHHYSHILEGPAGSGGRKGAGSMELVGGREEGRKGGREEHTTIPISFRSARETTSTVFSNTMFMNWSNPRSVPITCRLPFSLTNIMLIYC